MRFLYDYLFPVMWLAYIVYWRIMASDVKATERIEPSFSRLLRLVLMLSSLALLALPHFPVDFLNRRFLPASLWSFWIGAAVTACGLLFSVWARVHLGKNWSQAVTLKQDHELITTGPYALVRHPIYTGLLLAVLGTAIARGEWRGLLAFFLGFLALWSKLRLEEKWMRAHFGESYDAYSRRVSALLPYIV
ncbi:MAG TPA: isoprenylcysteine carboxylmethyltransferase family protein [Candidatus Eremiobacteraceae bacterium]|nr:isoprenylcysteine carboxylmethyltransferase family protein [Candidatus Eremiobacteraceae bacterium]